MKIGPAIHAVFLIRFQHCFLSYLLGINNTDIPRKMFFNEFLFMRTFGEKLATFCISQGLLDGKRNSSKYVITTPFYRHFYILKVGNSALNADTRSCKSRPTRTENLIENLLEKKTYRNVHMQTCHEKPTQNAKKFHTSCPRKTNFLQNYS